MKQIYRVLRADDVRDMCRELGLYTKGSSVEYDVLLEDIRAREARVTDKFLLNVAEDIEEHSTDECDLVNIVFELGKRVHTFLKE